MSTTDMPGSIKSSVLDARLAKITKAMVNESIEKSKDIVAQIDNLLAQQLIEPVEMLTGLAIYKKYVIPKKRRFMEFVR